MKIFISLLAMVFTLGLSQGSMAHDPDGKHKMEHKAVSDKLKVKQEMATKHKAHGVEGSVIIATPPPPPPDCEEGTDADCDTDDDQQKDVDTDGIGSAAEVEQPVKPFS